MSQSFLPDIDATKDTTNTTRTKPMLETLKTLKTIKTIKTVTHVAFTIIYNASFLQIFGLWVSIQFVINVP